MASGQRTDAEYSLLTGNLVAAPVLVALSNVSNASTELALGLYEAFCPSLCYLRQGGSSISATTTTGQPVAASTPRLFFVDASERAYVAGVLASGTATLFLSRL